MKLQDYCEEIIITEDQIKDIIKRISDEINRDYDGEEIIFVVTLKGAFMFASDLLKQIKTAAALEFMQISTYGDSHVSNNVFNVKLDLKTDIKGKNVIVLEDIVDSGFTSTCLMEYLAKREPKSLKMATFLNKSANRKYEFNPDYIGFELKDDAFVAGYGLDYGQIYRNIPFLFKLKKEIYCKD